MITCTLLSYSTAITFLVKPSSCELHEATTYGDVENKQDDTKEGHAEMASRYFQRTTMPTELARAAHKHLQSGAVQWTQNHFMGSPRPRREMYLVPDENALRVP